MADIGSLNPRTLKTETRAGVCINSLIHGALRKSRPYKMIEKKTLAQNMVEKACSSYLEFCINADPNPPVTKVSVKAMKIMVITIMPNCSGSRRRARMIETMRLINWEELFSKNFQISPFHAAEATSDCFKS